MRPVFDPSAVHHLKHRGAVDADGHLLEDAALWRHYIEAKYKDRALGIKRRGLSRMDPNVLIPPDSTVCREAEQLVAEWTGVMVANHSHRTYAWGAALAAQDDLHFDREVAYVASLLHDLYWERPATPSEPHCFTLPATDDAAALCRRAGWTDVRTEAVADAITLHLNVWPPRDAAEAYVVFVGARLDGLGGFIGRGLHDAAQHVAERLWQQVIRDAFGVDDPRNHEPDPENIDRDRELFGRQRQRHALFVSPLFHDTS